MKPETRNMKTWILLAVLTSSMLISCQGNEKKEKKIEPTETASMVVPKTWIKRRVEKAKTSLQQTDAGKVVWDAMEAHGGLEKYYSNGYLSFHFNYQPLGEGVPRNTYQIVDTWSNKARQKEAKDTTLQYGWNGETAWKVVKDSTSIPYDTRFWALTPYYFSAIPFVLDGAGVNLELLPQTNYKGQLNDVVKVTFAESTGDAPDDYYILYFSAESHKLTVIRYIVSYPAYFKKGQHMPEKFMDIFGEQVVEGITFPKSYKTYWLAADNLPGEYITAIELSEISFKKDVKKTYFDPPKDAVIVDGL